MKMVGGEGGDGHWEKIIISPVVFWIFVNGLYMFSHSGEMFSLNRDQIVIGMPAGEGEPVYIVRTGNKAFVQSPDR